MRRRPGLLTAMLLACCACVEQKSPDAQLLAPDGPSRGSAAPTAATTRDVARVTTDLRVAIPALPQAAYPTPAPRMVAKRRSRGGRMAVELSWSAVRGAREYRVQLARDIRFDELVANVKTRRPRHAARGLQPGVFFWRVRALGPRGVSDFTAPRGLIAMESAQRQRAAGPVPELGGAVEWTAPEPFAVYSSRVVTVSGTAALGSRLRVGLGPLLEPRGSFAVPLTLAPGRNEVLVTVEANGKISTARRVVFVVATEAARIDAPDLRNTWHELNAAKGRVEELDRVLAPLRERRPGAAAARDELRRIERLRSSAAHEVGELTLRVAELLRAQGSGADD